MTSIRRLLLLSSILACALPALAEIRTYTIFGQLVDDDPAFNSWSTYTLKLIYDTAATPVYSFGGFNATYAIISATLELDGSSGDLTIFSDNSLNKVIIRRESSYQGYDFYTYFPAYGDFSQGMAVAKLQGNFGSNYFSAFELPLDKLQMNVGNSTTISGWLPSSIAVEQSSVITVSDTVAVPEPATYALALAGACFVFVALKRRTRD